MRVESLAEQSLFTTVRIEASKPRQIASGTGFIFSYETKDSKSIPFIVTNKHVIAGFHKVEFFFTGADSNHNPMIGNRIDVSTGGLPASWHGHPDPQVDVAVLPIGPILHNLRNSGISVYYRSIDSEIVPSSSQLGELDTIEDVVFVGYPNGIYDQRNLLPVTRRGITATPVQVDYNGDPVFLIDASVFGGSSGSPVFIANSGGYADRRGLVVGNRLIFLGVVSSVFYRREHGEIVLESIPTGMTMVPVVQQMIDLGMVFKARTVVDTIEDFLRSRGAV